MLGDETKPDFTAMESKIVQQISMHTVRQHPSARLRTKLITEKSEEAVQRYWSY